MNLVQSQSISHFDGETRCAKCHHKVGDHCTDEDCCYFNFSDAIAGACFESKCHCYECIPVSVFLRLIA